MGIVSGQIMPNASRSIQRWDASICQHYSGVMDTYSRPQTAMDPTAATKRHLVSINDFQIEDRSGELKTCFLVC